MTNFLLGGLTLQCLVILGWGLKYSDRTIQYPFLSASVFAGWVLPQLYGLSNDPFLPGVALNKLIVMAMLCLGAIYFGYQRNMKPTRLFWWSFSYNRLLVGSVVLSIVGSFFFYQMSRLVPEAGMQWSGIITIYLFFSGLMTFGFVIALLLHLSRRSWVTMVIIIFNSSLYFERIFIAGRRAAMVEFVLIILLALWFKRKWLPSRWVIVSGLVASALLVNSIVDYRVATSQGGVSQTDWSEVVSIDYVGNFQRLLDEGGGELRNAAYGIEAVDRTLKLNYGISFWNVMVFRYVPAQFIGTELKSSLIVQLDDPARVVFGHMPWTGTTRTGIYTVFFSFWFFGAAIFALIAWIISRWYHAAIQGNMVAQILVMLMPSPALLSITHSHHHFFIPFIQWTVFLLPLFLFAKIKKPCQQTQIPMWQEEADGRYEKIIIQRKAGL